MTDDVRGDGKPGGSLIFVSHASEDAERARELLAKVMERGFEDVFFSSHPDLGIAPGEQWEPRLYENLRRAGALLFLLTGAALDSRWCFAELALARALGKPILTVRSGELTHPLTQALQAAALEDPSVVDRVCSWLERLVDPSRARWEAGRCPYPGMDAFTREFEPVFFGREANVEELLDVFAPLRSTEGTRRVVAVSGPSGSGKSSFVHAGVAARLARRPGWTVLPEFRPGADPVGNLAAAAAGRLGLDASPATLEDVRQKLLAADSGLLAHPAGPDADSTEAMPQLVVVVDQFEELLTVTEEAPRRLFLDLLDRMARGAAPVWVLLTVRAEFLGRAADPNDVSQFLGSHCLTYLLLPIGRDGEVIRRIVESPAAKAGVRVEEPAVDRIVADVTAGDPAGASLPLLALALREAWAHMEARLRGTGEPLVLSLADYLATGGVAGIVAAQAKAAVRRVELHGCGDAVLPTLGRFAVLTEPADRPARRRVPVAALSGCSERVAREFEERRLLRVVEGEGGPAYDVTHEAVFDGWDELRRYLDENRQAFLDLDEVERRGRAWDRGGRAAAELLGGALLERVAGLPQVEEDPLLVAYVAASLDADRVIRAGALRQQAERHAEEALAMLAAQPVTALELAATAGALCRDAGIEAPIGVQAALYTALCSARELRREVAHTASVRALAMAHRRDLVATGSDDRRIRLWECGGEREESPLEGHLAGIGALAFAPDDAVLASAGDDGRIIVWPLEQGTEQRSLSIAPDVPTALAFDPSGEHLIAVSEAGVLRVWRLADLALLRSVEAHGGFATACAVGPECVFTAGSDGHVAAWRPADLTLLSRVEAEEGPILALAVSPDGHVVATGGLGGRIRLWTDELAPLTGPLRAHAKYVSAVGFGPGGRSLVSTGGDGLVRQWGLDGRPLESPLAGHDGPVCALAVRAAPPVIVSGGVDRTLRRFELRGSLLADPVTGFPEPINAVLFPTESRLLVACGPLIHPFSDAGEAAGRPWDGHQDYVWAMAAGPGGDVVATASADRTLMLWDLEGRPLTDPMRGHQADVTNVAFTPDGASIVSASSDCTLRLWRRDGSLALDVLGSHDGQVNVVQVVETGGATRVLSGGNDGWVILWALDGDRVAAVRAHEGAVRYAAISPDGSRVLTVGEEGELRSWRLPDLEPGPRIPAHDGPVSMVVAWPGGVILTCGFDGLVRRFSADLLQIGEPLLAHPRGAWALAVSPSGDRFATGGEDATVRVWRGGTWPTWLAAAEERRSGASAHSGGANASTGH